MIPLADVTYLTVQAWSLIDCISWEGLDGGWIRIGLDEYHRQSMRHGCPQPLGERIGLLRRAWIKELEFLPGVTEPMEHWVQLRHDGVRCRYASETYARRIEGQVRVFRTLPECIAGEGGMPLEEARTLAPPAYCPPLAEHLWSVDPGSLDDDDTYDASMMRHPLVGRSATHLFVKWRQTDKRPFAVRRDELERSGYAEPETDPRDAGLTLYAAREFAEALLDPDVLAQWRRQGLEEDLRQRGRSCFDLDEYFAAKDHRLGEEAPEQQAERLRRAEEYIYGPRIFSA